MSGPIHTVDINIMGRDFTVSCTDSERQGLLDAVGFLDKKMCEIRDAGKVVSVERIAIMAALNIAHELLSAKSGGIDIGGIKRTILNMQDQIDAVITQR